MATYKGEVVRTTDDDFPFAAIISDQDGNVVGEYPVRTRADGEAKVHEVLKKLPADGPDPGTVVFKPIVRVDQAT